MLERVIANGIPIYYDEATSAAYIYDTEQIRVGTYDGTSLTLDPDWKERTKTRYEQWSASLEVRSRNAAGK